MGSKPQETQKVRVVSQGGLKMTEMHISRCCGKGLGARSCALRPETVTLPVGKFPGQQWPLSAVARIAPSFTCRAHGSLKAPNKPRM